MEMEVQLNSRHINDLPEVVIEYIFTQLSPYSDLLNCKLVCKSWYHLTYSALHKIKLDFKLAIKNLNIEWNKYTSSTWPNISGRYSHSTCLNLHNMYIFGGCTNRSTSSINSRTQTNMCTTFNDLWVFDLDDKTWYRPLGSGCYPPPKACASMVNYQNKLYLYGGWAHCSSYPLNQDWKLFDDLHSYDIDENKWTLIKSVNKANEPNCPSMAGHCASVVNDKMIIYGGLLFSLNLNLNFDPLSVNRDFWIYDFKTNKWSKKEAINSGQNPGPRYGHTQIVLDDQHLLVIGGCSSPKVLYNDIWLLKMNLDDLNEEWQWNRVQIEQNDAFHLPIFGFHQAVKVDNMIVFLSTNSKTPIESTKNLRKLFRDNENQASSSNDNQQPSSSNHNQQQVNRLEAQPTPNERRLRFLESFQKLTSHHTFNNEHRSQPLQKPEKNDTGPASKQPKSSTITLKTIKNEYRLKPHNPMFFHVLDISNILSTFKVSWLNQVRKFDVHGPDEIMLYSFVASANELILFGGVEKVPLNHLDLTDNKLEIVSNSVYVASAKNVVI